MKNFINLFLIHFIMNFIRIKCEDELVMLIEMFRHGSRNPSNFYNNKSAFPDPYLGKSDLTPVGYR